MRSILLCFLFAGIQASGQIVVKVNEAAPLTMSAADFSKLPRHTATLTEHGKQSTYDGVLLHDLLAKAGLEFGKELKGKQLSSYVAAMASDGYEVVYALAEMDDTVVESGIIVADKKDGQPLDAHEGPMRVVAPHDKRPTRSIRMLQEIDVVQLKK